MTKNRFLELAEAHGLRHIGEELYSVSLPSARVLEKALRPAQPEDTTFVGGAPAPVPSEWPDHEGTPMTFIGQVDTSRFPSGVCPVELPEGILQFFVSATAEESSEYEPTLDCGRVLFVNPEQAAHEPSAKAKCEEPVREPSLLRTIMGIFRPHTRREDSTAGTCRGSFEHRAFDWEVFPSLHIAAPDGDALWMPEAAQSFEFDYDADEDSYSEFRGSVLAPSQHTLVQMFGFVEEKQPFQGDMQTLVNVAAGNRSANEFREWLPLFFFDASCGGVAPAAVGYYFWIHRDDLSDANFDEVWLCVQRD